MEISQINSMSDLLDLYAEKDVNKNGTLEAAEIEDVTRYDRDNDNALSAWEVMVAAEFGRNVRIFADGQTVAVRQLNSQGIAFPSIDIEEDTTIAGIEFEGTYIWLHENGRVKEGRLARGATVQGIRLESEDELTFYDSGDLESVNAGDEGITVQNIRYVGVVRFYENGRVSSGTLAKDTLIQGVRFETGTQVFFKSNGRLDGVEGVDVTIKGIKFRAAYRGYPGPSFGYGGPVQSDFGKRHDIVFHNSGRVSYGELAEDTNIDGIKFMGGSGVHFHSNGRVSSGVLAEDTILNGLLFKAETEVEFYETGCFRGGTLYTNKTVQGMTFSENTNIYFHENGRISSGTLADGAVVQGLTLVAGYQIFFHSNGKVSIGQMAGGTVINGIKFTEGTISFHRNGRVSYGGLAEDTSIQGMTFEGGRLFPNIYFHGNGRVSRGILASDTTIDGITYAGDEIAFHGNGRVSSGKLAQDRIINGIEFKAGGIEFHRNGRVAFGMLAEETVISDKKYSAGTKVRFNSDGTISSVFNENERIPGSAINVDLWQMEFFNGAYNVTSRGGEISFMSDGSEDPGFYVPCGIDNLEEKRILKFDVRGYIVKYGHSARLIAQVYSDTDDDYFPSVSLDPIQISGDYETIRFDIGNRIDKIRKIQFLLASDLGSCRVDIKNIRFE